MHHEISTNTYSPHLDDNSDRCAAAVYVHQWINNNMSGLSLGDSRRAEASKSTHPLPWGAYYYYRSLVQWSGGFTAPELNTWQWHYIYDISILIPPANFHVRATQKYPWAKWSSNLTLSLLFQGGVLLWSEWEPRGLSLTSSHMWRKRQSLWWKGLTQASEADDRWFKSHCHQSWEGCAKGSAQLSI